jgi:hypothetical protein
MLGVVRSVWPGAWPRMRQLLCVATAIALLACAGAAASGAGAVASGPRADAARAAKCAGKKVTKKGTRRADRLKGTRKADVIAGLGGNDTIKGLAGNDTVCGGAGNDKLRGNAGRDKLVGGKGTDNCLGGPGRDTIRSCETGDVKPTPPDVVYVAPTVSTSTGSGAWVENAGPVPFDSGVTVSDLDSLSLQGATVRIASNHVPGEDQLGFANQLGITGTYNDATGTLTLSGSATLADYQTALRSVTYGNSSNTPSTATRTLSVQVTDATALASNTSTRNMTLTAANDPPAVTTSAGDLDYAEGDSGRVVDAALTVSDPDDTNLEGATVRVSSGFVALENDALNFTDQNGITGTYDSGTGVLTLTGPASVANYQTALRSITFDTDAVSGGSRTIEFNVNDGDGDSAPATKDVTIIPPNTAPVVDADPTSTNLAYTENDGAVAVDPGVTVTDPDSGQSGATVAITGNYDSGQDSLGFTNQNGISGSFDSSTGVLTLTGAASTADYQTALQSVTYTNSSENPSTAPRTVSFQTTDSHGAPSNTDTRTIDITAVDDPPVAVDDAATVLEDAAATAVSVLANDTDIDGGTPTIASATAPANGTVVLTGGSPGAHTGLTYQPDPDYCNDPPGTTPDTFTYTLTGGDSAQVSMTVTCVNDAPVADDETFNGNDSAIGNTTMVVNDPDDAAPNPSGPKTTVSGDILAGDSDADGPGPLTVTPGTFATNDGGSVTIESDGDFTFQPAAGTSCSDTSDFFDYTVTDSGSPEQSDTGRVTIAIAGCVWYVSNNAAGNSGTSTAPFDTLAQAEASSGANHTVFVYDGDNTSTGYGTGYAMNAGERLIGEDEALVVDPDGGGSLTADTLYPANPGATPTLTANNEDVVDLDDGNEVRGFALDPQGTGGGIAGASGDTGGGTIADVSVLDMGTPGTQPGVELDSTTGTFNFQDLTVSTSGATAVRLNNAGTTRFADTGTISLTASGATGLDASGTGMGPGSFFDDITVTGSPSGGVSMSNTTGTTTLGDGSGTDLALTTTSGANPAFLLSNAGTVSVPGAGTANVSATGGPAVDVTGTSGATLDFDDVDSTNSANDGINLDGLGSGTFSAASGDIGGATGIAFDLNGGSGNVTYPGALSNGSGATAEITGRSGGAVSLSGAVTDTNDAGGGVTVSNNTGGSTTFSAAAKTLNTGAGAAVLFDTSDGHTLTLSGGGLDVDTSTGNGIVATNSGTLVVSGGGNSITTTTGRPLNVTNTDVGGTPLTFEQVSSNGASNGILLNNTGINSALTVTSTGAGTCTAANFSGCTGGSILNSTGADDAGATPGGTAVVLNNTRGVSLTRMRISGNSNYGIRGTNVTDLALANSIIHGVNGTTALTANKDSSARFDQLTGTVSITDTEMSGGFTSNLLVNNTSGTLNATLTNFKSGTLDATGGDDGVQFEGLGTSTVNATVQGSTFTTATGDLFQFIGNGTGGGTLSFTGNTLSNNEPSIATGGGGVTLSGAAEGNETITFSNNTLRDSKTAALTINKSQDGTGADHTQTVTVSGNTIGVTGVDNSGSLEGSGISVTNFGDGNQTLSITNNNIRQYNSTGMRFVAGAGVAESGQLNLNISGNTLAEPGNNPSVTLLQGIRIESGVTAGDTFQTCANFGANNMHPSGDPALSGGASDYRFVVAQSTTLKLPGYGGSSTDDAAVVTFVNGKIGNGATGTSVRANSGTYLGGASCP